ncbi:hypothetical protein [Mariniblastus fucicola]|uniref:Uncharacterized protein n=2 Tax=Mariniblastus fucicola TaxID=980251 RepID=A0A5B9PFU3_9BACT|nr:hypothetical protein [Mariniblastus fucicola]QEG24065.1 hypothetical protein MFFC18_39810 [Mariniblastus fucicola]
MVSAECVHADSGEFLQLILGAREITDEDERNAFSKDVIDGIVEGLQADGMKNVRMSGPERDGKRKNQFIYRATGEIQNGVKLHMDMRFKFGDTSLVIVAFGDSPERASELSKVINTANKNRDGEEFKSALDRFRRIDARQLGFSIEPPPLDMALVVSDASSMRLQSPGGAYIFVRTMAIKDEFDIDKAWAMMQKMAISPNAGADDEGNAKIDGQEARFKSYFQSAGSDKLWGTTWLFANEDRFYLVTGMCLENKKGSEGKAILRSIKGLKFDQE